MAVAQADGWHLWTRADEHVLATGWVAGTPMTELVTRTGVSEPAIVRHLLGRRLAMTMDEIVSRIGLVPGGDLALRHALAAGEAEARVWCVVVTGDSLPMQISIHASQADAESARGEAFQQDARWQAGALVDRRAHSGQWKQRTDQRWLDIRVSGEARRTEKAPSELEPAPRR